MALKVGASFSPLDIMPVDMLPSKTEADKHPCDAIPKDAKVYRTGTLQYSLRGLMVLFLWLLWGDFAFTFFESIFGKFIPLYLKEFNASNSLIGVMTGSFAGLVNLLFLPNISQWSDHFRSRYGRRIPFLYVATPLTVVSLIGVGSAPEVASWLNTSVISHLAPSVATGTIVIVLLGSLAISFHFFNMVLVNAYNWLLKDVVPEEVMARFLSWFRIVSTVSSALFQWFVFPHILTYRREVFLGVGIFYLVSFLMMCHNVKEGEYPTPPQLAKQPGIFQSFATYFRECVSIPIYRNFFIVYILYVVAIGCSSPFAVLFHRQTLGLTMDDIGKVAALVAGVSSLAYFVLGWVCEKVSSILVTLVAVVFQVFVSSCSYFCVVDRNSFFMWSMIGSLAAVGWGLGSAAMTMKIFPEEKFGQFSSGLSIFGCGAMILGNLLVGPFMDLFHSNYRMIYIWIIASMGIAIVPLILVYRDWLRFGGPHHYVAPLPESAASGNSSR